MKRKQSQEVRSGDGSGTPKKQRILDDEGSGGDSPTPKATANGAFQTPTKSTRKKSRPSTNATKADRSAKRKSAATLLENEEDHEFGAALAQEILDEDENEDDEAEDLEPGAEALPGLRDDLAELAASALQETPSKRSRGRPKGSKNRRSPTPDGDLPPEERYFFQNRTGPPEVSSNTLASLKLLSHDEYFAVMAGYRDGHAAEKAQLLKLHARSFPQWRFEWHEGFNLCLYGWGSKRRLVNHFARWLLHQRDDPAPKIVVVNGYTPKLNMRTILTLLINTAMENGNGPPPTRVGAAQPAEMLELLLSHLSAHPPATPIILLINSIDSIALRRPSIQALFARLADHASIHLLATADTPSFPLLWDAQLRDRFAFVFHDCTTYAAYAAELDVVSDVHELLGKKGRRVGGGEGVGYVLRSLTENSRKLYVLLLTEILSALGDEGMVDGEGEGEGEGVEGKGGDGGRGGRRRPGPGQEMEGEVGVEYRSLYQKASESFVCSSEMNFRTLLKEFYDHEMISSRKDGVGGAELLGVPLGKEEMETLLEELVMAGG